MVLGFSVHCSSSFCSECFSALRSLQLTLLNDCNPSGLSWGKTECFEEHRRWAGPALRSTKRIHSVTQALSVTRVPSGIRSMLWTLGTLIQTRKIHPAGVSATRTSLDPEREIVTTTHSFGWPFESNWDSIGFRSFEYEFEYRFAEYEKSRFSNPKLT